MPTNFLWQYQPVAQPVFIPTPEVITVDKWFEPLSVPSKLVKDRAASFPTFLTPVQPQSNDQIGWFRPLIEPKKLSRDRVADFPSFTYGALPIVVPTDGWWQNLATPPKAKPGLGAHEQQAVAYPIPIITESITMDKWWHQLSKPQKLSKDRTAEYRAFTFGQTPIVSTPDRWWQNFSTPPKAKSRTTEYPFSAFYGPTPIVSTPDRWWRNFDTPPKAKARTVEYRFTTIAPDQTQPLQNIGWFNGFTQPTRRNLGLNYQMQESQYRAPLIVYGPYTMGYIIV